MPALPYTPAGEDQVWKNHLVATISNNAEQGMSQQLMIPWLFRSHGCTCFLPYRMRHGPRQQYTEGLAAASFASNPPHRDAIFQPEADQIPSLLELAGLGCLPYRPPHQRARGAALAPLAPCAALTFQMHGQRLFAAKSLAERATKPTGYWKGGDVHSAAVYGGEFARASAPSWPCSLTGMPCPDV